MALIHYLIKAGELAHSKAFVRELAQRMPQHGEALMTIAQQLEQKGIELGEKRGIEKGERGATLHAAERPRQQYRHADDRSHRRGSGSNPSLS